MARRNGPSTLPMTKGQATQWRNRLVEAAPMAGWELCLDDDLSWYIREGDGAVHTTGAGCKARLSEIEGAKPVFAIYCTTNRTWYVNTRRSPWSYEHEDATTWKTQGAASRMLFLARRRWGDQLELRALRAGAPLAGNPGKLGWRAS